ncbi:hypothetical protein V8B55DRAFT_1573636, partial [Mucor lusitanicus]
SVVKSLHARLDVFYQPAQQAQQALNGHFRQEIASLYSLLANFGQTNRSPVPLSAPTHSALADTAAANSITDFSTQTPSSQFKPPPLCTHILQRPSSNLTKRRRAASTLSLRLTHSATDSTLFTAFHLHRSHRMSHNDELCATLDAIDVDSKRVLDVTFPACNTTSILILTDYQQAHVLKGLSDDEFQFLPNFISPVDSKYIPDLMYTDMPAPQLARITVALHTDR